MKTAVIGAGHLGTYHAEKYARIESSQLVAIVDSDIAKASKLAKRVGAQAFSSVDEILSLGIQCASVATTTSTHHQVAKTLLENGVDVLVEKPICSTIDDARSLIDIADKHQRILQVGHLERFNPAFKEMKEVLTQPHFFEVRRIAPFSGRGHDVDVVLDLMIHDIDIVTHLVGRPVEHVDALGIPVVTSSFDIANVRLRFEGGATANVTASRAAFAAERTIRVFQPEVYISLDYLKKRLKICTRAEKKSLLGFSDIKVVKRKVHEADALENQIRSFMRASKERSIPEVTGEDGLRALELAERIKQSIQEGIDRFERDAPMREAQGQ